jgi:hypothetical protein
VTARVKQETCTRCGHTTPDCETCDRQWPFLGAGIGERRYCHTFVEGHSPTCYEAAQWDSSTGLLGGLPWVHWPREESGEGVGTWARE